MSRMIGSLFANDPIYRRVKDAVLVLVAITATLSMIDIPFLKKENAPDSTKLQKIEDRLAKTEITVEVTRTSMLSIDSKLSRMEDKLDRAIERNRYVR